MKLTANRLWRNTAVVRLLAAVCLIVVSAMPALAAQHNVLVVELRNGNVDNYMLAEKPQVTFSGEKCKIVSSSLTTEYDMANVLQAYFSEDKSSVEAPMEEFTLVFTDPDTVQLSGVPAGSAVALYSMAGSLLSSVTADANGAATVSLNGLDKGVYVIQTANNKSFKIYRK